MRVVSAAELARPYIRSSHLAVKANGRTAFAGSIFLFYDTGRAGDLRLFGLLVR